MSRGMAICSLDDLGDPECLGIGKTYHLLELSPLEEEGIIFTLLGVDYFAGTIQFSLFEIAVEALPGLIQLQYALPSGLTCFDLA